MTSAPPISVFPKCYFDELRRGEMDYVAWIRSAATLGGEGLEHYDGFFRSLRPRTSIPSIAAMAETGQISSMLCFSPDFTHPGPGERRAAGRAAAGGDRSRRQARYAFLPHAERPGASGSVARATGSRGRSTGSAARSTTPSARDVVLCLENHYKDGTWRYPEFAQPEDSFSEILERVDSPRLGVQYDPSNAIVGGYDPIRFLEKVLPRVVTMHASDRYARAGRDAGRSASRATAPLGYSGQLRHGDIGKGLIDYDAIFRILARRGFTGWISVEDGMNGLDELARSVDVPEGEARRVLPMIHGARIYNFFLSVAVPPSA